MKTELLLSVVAALATLGIGWWLKGTPYENAWVYVLPVYFFIVAGIKVYSAYSQKKKDKDQ